LNGTSFWQRRRQPLLAGLALVIFGVGIYLPIAAVSGRYTMPAVWGIDLWMAILLSELALVPERGKGRLAYAAFGCGLLAVAIANLGKQEKFASRAALLWQALEYVERQAPRGTCIEWQSQADLNPEEGIHFHWHLAARGRGDLRIRLLGPDNQPLQRCELNHPAPKADFRMTGLAPSAVEGAWHLSRPGSSALSESLAPTVTENYALQ
jgi:hypothetical protein